MDMTSDKDRVVKAMENFHKRENAKFNKKKRLVPNKTPEEDVVKELVTFYTKNDFFIKRYESKAKLIGGVWRASGLSVGTPDLGGVCPNGFAHWNEVKAKGKRSALREEQKQFLQEVIKRGGFGIVCDSLVYLETVYTKWLDLGRSERMHYLIDELP